MADFSIQDWKAAIIIIGILVGYIVALTGWMVKIQSQISSIEKEQKRNDQANAQIWNKIDTLQISMSEIHKSLSRIEGKLEISFRNIPKQ